MKRLVMFLAGALMLMGCNVTEQSAEFVEVRDGRFYIGKERYTYAGANYWQGMNLGSTKYGNREQLCRELDQLKSYGITNLRILAATEGDAESRYAILPALQSAPESYDDNLWEGLDYLLVEMGKRDMRAVVVLSNFWTWSGGFSQYLKWAGYGEIPYPQDEGNTWGDYSHYTKEFFKSEKALAWYRNHLIKSVTRRNSISGVLYAEDPTIMSWQLANEPRGVDYIEEFATWVKSSSALIKELAPKQLVSLGSEGDTPNPTNEGLRAIVDNAYETIDYITMHIWVQNWMWYTPGEGAEKYAEMIERFDRYWREHVEVAHKLGKPLVLEEYGLARDMFSYDPLSPCTERDAYYNYVYSRFADQVEQSGAVQGVNFWGYSGEARPARAGQYWQQGDAFLADPPHEKQGWYGVYDSDVSTLELIKGQVERLP